MSTVKTWRTVSSSSEATSEIAEQLGRACKGREVFLLKSDLGGGKTTFVQGLAKGLGSADHVGSPTFTLNRSYKARDGFELQHFDFYRLNDAGIIAHELAEFINEPNTVVAVEWGDIVSDTLPADRVEVVIERIAEDENKRAITVNFPEKLNYLKEALA